jgi:DNA excision repair protein ERCC-8
MNQLYLGHRLGAVGSASSQRYQNERNIYSLEHHENLTFALSSTQHSSSEESSDVGSIQAHAGGVNCLAFHQDDTRHLVSAGGDAAIRLWDLEEPSSNKPTYVPIASLSKSNDQAHQHAITSLSTYPFDPTPTTLLSTAFDDTFKLTSITPSSLQPIHSFSLGYRAYTHAISPIPSTTPLIAVGTAHPAIRLLDLRSGLSTHSLPGHNGAIYSLAWSPVTPHLLISGSHDGRVLFFDVRRANAAFASLNHDNSIGFDPSEQPSLLSSQPQLLNFSSVAHTGPVTSVQFYPSSNPSSLVTTGHDQRIRLWDLTTGRNELVHFGHRIRNNRIGHLAPLLTPPGYAMKAAREALFWPNDDARGEIMMHSLREGELIRVMKMRGLDVADAQREKGKVARLRSKGRINQIVWRGVSAETTGGLEMVSAHGDGSIGIWKAEVDEEEEEEDGTGKEVEVDSEEEERIRKRKRNVEMLGELVQGLTKATRVQR